MILIIYVVNRRSNPTMGSYPIFHYLYLLSNPVVSLLISWNLGCEVNWATGQLGRFILLFIIWDISMIFDLGAVLVPRHKNIYKIQSFNHISNHINQSIIQMRFISFICLYEQNIKFSINLLQEINRYWTIWRMD